MSAFPPLWEERDPTPLEERRMVAFALTWEPFGGPRAEDVFVEFGMTLERFHRRLAEIARKQGRSRRPEGRSLAV